MEMKGIRTNRTAEIKNVSGTAFVVAEFRAEENNEVHPLYRDSIVRLFLNEDSKQAAARIAASFPPAKDLVKTRTKYFDDMLERQILSGCRQVVLLGAGLDTRAVRKPTTGVTYFEIDDAATLKMKQACYEEQGIRANVKFIPGNYVTDGLIAMLQESHFDFDLPTYLIWEGNTMYLPLESTKRIMAQLREHLKHFRLSFDYMAEAVIAKTTGDPGITSLVESFANMGAPWLSGIREIQTLADEIPLRVIENFQTAELYQTYRHGRLLASPIFKFYSVCTLGSDSLMNLRTSVRGRDLIAHPLDGGLEHDLISRLPQVPAEGRVAVPGPATGISN
jgi:methyltransferase (TIGR00027 family)